jgi:Amt family ammonium transporter
VSAGDTAWLLAATALVLLMTPGLALFYGGMVRTKSVLNMLMMSFASIAVGTVVWLAAGWTLAFGQDLGGAGLLGGFGQSGLHGITPLSVTGHVPTLLYVTFQGTFAVLTSALISGSIADRARFGSWMVFVALWMLLVYAPEAHWVWGPGGWIGQQLKALDFAGGTVVEVSSGASGLALALVLGPRLGFRRDPMRPHSLPLVLLGAGLLWFGWFGFNAGSALGANGLAAAALLNTQAAACTGLLGWLAVEKRRDGHATTLGAASGAVAGMVAITPSCGSVGLLGAVVIGLVAGVLCSYAVSWKFRLGYDDSLDVVGVHLVAGIVGTLLIGLFATGMMTSLSGAGQRGLFYGGGLDQLWRQAVAILAVGAYSFGMSWLLGKAIDRVGPGFRAHRDHELTGLDLSVHAESAYDHGGHAASAVVGGSGIRAAADGR